MDSPHDRAGQAGSRSFMPPPAVLSRRRRRRSSLPQFLREGFAGRRGRGFNPNVRAGLRTRARHESLSPAQRPGVRSRIPFDLGGGDLKLIRRLSPCRYGPGRRRRCRNLVKCRKRSRLVRHPRHVVGHRRIRVHLGLGERISGAAGRQHGDSHATEHAPGGGPERRTCKKSKRRVHFRLGLMPLSRRAEERGRFRSKGMRKREDNGR